MWQKEHREVSGPVGPRRKVETRISRANWTCAAGCICNCHDQRTAKTPAILSRVLGKTFVNYQGLPYLSPRCDIGTCTTAQKPSVRAEYWFPAGLFWSQIVQLQVEYQKRLGPQFQLKTYRRVPDSAQSINFALDGNIEGLKDLFLTGRASPNDVSDTRGYTLLRWALYGQQYETCRFLVQAGVDPDYRPVSKFDNSPRNKASDYVLQGGLPKGAIEALSCLTSASDWIDDQNFTQIHRIVTGLSMQDLDKEISLHPGDVNARDAMDRTPLIWACARGNEQAVVTLLANGADPDSMDVQCSQALSYAADRNHTRCVRIMCEAGAVLDPVIPGGYKMGSALNCAARNAKDPLLLKTLLDFGADVEASGVDGKTSLIHAARTDNVNFALLLLQYGANINATTASGQTPLTTAVTYNSHRTLQLLLERWNEYSPSPRLTGPHLLEITALYGDMETLHILKQVEHFRVSFDAKYTGRNYEAPLRTRVDYNEELIDAFQELLHLWSAGHTRGQCQSVESMLEAGLAGAAEKNSSLLNQEVSSDSDEEMQFVDTKSDFPLVSLS